ncbi:MAG: hypothetical protein M5R40_08775 [Anaerolineae bacterium]|nr:hypothetical protein [Anaerolineae bacterium]
MRRIIREDAVRAIPNTRPRRSFGSTVPRMSSHPTADMPSQIANVPMPRKMITRIGTGFSTPSSTMLRAMTNIMERPGMPGITTQSRFRVERATAGATSKLWDHHAHGEKHADDPDQDFRFAQPADEVRQNGLAVHEREADREGQKVDHEQEEVAAVEGRSQAGRRLGDRCTRHADLRIGE